MCCGGSIAADYLRERSETFKALKKVNEYMIKNIWKSNAMPGWIWYKQTVSFF